MFTFTDCTGVTVSEFSTSESLGYTDVTVMIPSLTPVHPSANTIRLHIWSLSPSSFNLDISTRNLVRVAEWRIEPSCADNRNQFQTARITATAEFVSGSQSFETNVYPLITNNVSK